MPNIGAIILAAGMSSRMGQPKLLLPINGKPLFRYCLETALRQQLQPILFIGGEHFHTFQSQAADLQGIEFFENIEYRQGLSSTLKLGIEKISDRAAASFIFLADQPFVPDIVVQFLIATYQKEVSNGILVVRPSYHEQPGHPVLIDKSLFTEFLNLDGDQGGKAVIQKHREQTKILPFEHSFWGKDIDTMDDYQTSKFYL